MSQPRENVQVSVSEGKKVVIVTGGNRGIGFHACKNLGNEKYEIIVSSRSLESGEEAKKKLKSEYGVNVHILQLDLCNDESIENFASDIKNRFGRVDVLINNAGVAIVSNMESSFIGYGEKLDFVTANRTMRTNYFGTVKLTEFLLPLIPRDSGRVIFLSSRMSIMTAKTNLHSDLRQKFFQLKTKAELDSLLHQFVGYVKEGSQFENGYIKGHIVLSYGVSKFGINLYARILSNENRGLTVITCHPGFVDTYMTRLSSNKKISSDDGGKRIVWCVDCDKEKYAGKFINLDNKEIVDLEM